MVVPWDHSGRCGKAGFLIGAPWWCPCLEGDSTHLPGEVMPETRPQPVFRVGDQTARDRVPVDVPQLLHAFAVREHIKVVIPGLPEWRSRERRETEVLSAWIARARLPRSGSVTCRCTCSGITT